jgi:hypothetical protein
MVNQPDQAPQVIEAHLVLGVHLGHLDQGGQEQQAPYLPFQLFPQPAVVTGQKGGIFGGLSATTGADRHNQSSLLFLLFNFLFSLLKKVTIVKL